MNVPTEQQEAEVLAQWLKLNKYQFTHIPNETGSDIMARRRAVRMKRAGVSRGFPDYLIFKDGKRFAVELKRTKGNKPTKEQLDWLEVLDNHGFYVKVAFGAKDAIEWLSLFKEKKK